MKLAYQRNYLVESYLRKYEELGRPPTVKEIKEDPDMPSYWAYYRHLGGKEDICRMLNLKNIPASTYQRLCEDCMYEPDGCGHKPYECAQEAELYFKYA